MATAGYLISRAAERPAILSLTVAIVGVRFFGLARPLARYLERLASHDLAFRVLGRVRVRVYERIEPLAPAQLEGYRHGDLLSRMVADVDALQNLHLRCVGPPLVALAAAAVSVGVAAAFSPAAGLVLAAGLLVGRRRRAGGRRRARSPRRPPAGRGARRALRRARRAPALRARARGLRAGGATGWRACARPTERWCGWPGATRSPAASATGLGLLVTGRDGRGRARGHGLGARGRRARPGADRDARAPRARVLRGRPAADGGRARAVGDARRGAARPRADRPRAGGGRSRDAGAAAVVAVRRRARGRARPLRLRRGPGARRASASGSSRGVVSRSSGRAGRGRRRSSTCSFGSSIPEHGRVTLAGRDLRDVPPGGRPSRLRRGRPGLAPLLDEHPRERSPRPPGRRRRGARGRATPRADLGLGAVAPGRLGHARGRGGPRALGWRAPADRARARAARRRARCSCSTSRPRTSTRPQRRS